MRICHASLSSRVASLLGNELLTLIRVPWTLEDYSVTRIEPRRGRLLAIRIPVFRDERHLPEVIPGRDRLPWHGCASSLARLVLSIPRCSCFFSPFFLGALISSLAISIIPSAHPRTEMGHITSLCLVRTRDTVHFDLGPSVASWSVLDRPRGYPDIQISRRNVFSTESRL